MVLNAFARCRRNEDIGRVQPSEGTVNEVARKRIRVSRKPADITASALRKLQGLPDNLPTSPPELRSRVIEFVGLSRDLKELALAHVQAVLPQESASERILEYLRLFVGTEINGEELEIVSGISEYARRVREWRVEFGWPIRHKAERYTLERNVPDPEKAQLWQILNGIRRSGEGAREKMRSLFLALPVGSVVKTLQLKYVTEGKDMRRVRELRTELGYRIMTKKTGMPSLKNDEYVLVDREPVAEHDRHIDDKIMVAVLERDGQRCRKCGWDPNRRVPGDPRQYIEIHHMTWHVQGGANEIDNLVTLCNVDHKEVHRLKLDRAGLEKWLKEPK